MAMGGWKTAAVFRRYAIVSSADQRAAVAMLEAAQAERAQVTSYGDDSVAGAESKRALRL